MATLDDFMKDVRPHIPGCPDGVALNAIRNACIRFCTDTWIIREDLKTINADADEDTYALTPAATYNTVVGIVSFLYDDVELDKKTEEELDIIDYGWRTADQGTPTFVTSPDSPASVTLNRKPETGTTSTMKVRVAIRPKRTATTVPDLLLSEWLSAIKYGALEELYEIPGKGWSDMKQSMWYGKKFNFQVQRGKARARMGHMTKSTAARQRAWI
jgi:hypothetical protein